MCNFLVLAFFGKKQLRNISLNDSLSSIGEFVPANEHVDIVLDRLPDEFESLVTRISYRFEPLMIDEVKTFLLAHETRIENSCKKSIASINLTKVFKPNFCLNSSKQVCSYTTPELQANLA